MGIATFTPATAGQVCTAAYFNGVINAILNQLNGNIETINLANLSVTAGKLASGAVTGPKIAMGSDAQGDILYYNGTQYARLGAGTSGQVLVTGGAGSNPSWGYSKTVQVINTQSGAYIAVASVIPYDNSIPDISEGGEVMTATITPKSASNVLRIDVNHVTSNVGGIIVTALFQDSTAAALAATAYTPYSGGGGYGQISSLTYFMTAGTTSATTFRVRIGASSGTAYFNGSVGSRVFGGVASSSITITEIKV